MDFSNMADKYFKLREAEELLPMIGLYLTEARDHKQKVDGMNDELSHASARIMVLGGSIPPHNDLSRLKAERDEIASQVQDAVSKILETGCLVKDLDEGLVDFPTLLNGEEVYLCWKLGEKHIGFYHGIQEGFAGRKPLDDSPPSDDAPPGPQRIH
jgi:hypothetical protein